MTELIGNKLSHLNVDKSNWTPVKFGEIAFEPKETVKDVFKEDIKYVVGLEHIKTGDIHLRSSNSIEESTTFTKKFSPGDLLFGRRRAYLKKAAQAKFTGICSGDIIVMRASDILIPELLPFVVNNDKFFDWAITHSAGGLSPRCKFKDLANYKLLLPPVDQQNEIAKLLWTMDDLVQNDINTLSNQYRLFHSYSKSIFKEGQGQPRALKDIGTLTMGQSPSGSSYNETGDGIPFLQGNAEFGKKHPSNIKYTTAPSKLVQKNTILISVRAPVGDLNIADKEYCIGRGLAGIYIEDEVLRDYVFNFIKYAKTELEKSSTGSTFKAINKDILSSLKVFVPETKELLKCKKILDSILSAIEDLETKIENSKALQKSLTNQFF